MKRLIQIGCLTATIGLISTQTVWSDGPAVRIYVAPDGKERAQGTLQDPLGTLSSAQGAVREVLADKSHAEVNVLLAGGIYRLSKPVELGPKDSPGAGGVVRWKARQGETPIISGGRPINGWEAQADGSWKTTIPKVANGEWEFRELYVNGERRSRARHPSTGYLRIEEAAPDDRSWFRYRKPDIPKETDANGMELVFFHDWAITRIEVAEIDRAKRILRPAGPIGSTLDFFTITNWEPHPRYWLENDPAFLDRPGEWFLDKETGELTYLPKKGERINNAAIVAPAAHSLLTIQGTPENRVRHLRFQGLRFAHAAWPIPDGHYWGIQATMHDQNRRGKRAWVPSAISLELANDCRFEGGQISHIGMSGIHLGSRTRNCAIRGMRITDIAGNGIRIGEGRMRKRDGQSWWQAAPGEAATGNTVTDSFIERTGQVLHGAVGIWVGLARETQIAHNVVRRLPYTGISVGWMWNPTRTPARGNLIEYNHIHHVMQRLADGGGIYTLGRQPGSYLRANWIHDIPREAGRAGANGIFLDQGTNEFVLEANVIHDTERSPLRWHQAHENLVRNNVLVHRSNVPTARYHGMEPEPITYRDNTILESDQWEPSQGDHYTRWTGPRPPFK